MKTFLEVYLAAYTYFFTRSKRLLFVIGVISGVFAALFFLSDSFTYSISDAVNYDFRKSLVPAAFMLLAIISLSLLYLQSGGNNSAELEKDTLQGLYTESLINKKKLEENSELLAFLEKRLEAYESEKGLTVETRQKIIDGAVAQIGEGALKKIFSEETLRLEESIRKTLSLDALSDSSLEIVSRLRREISDLRLRSNINLVIGMSITAIGLYLLWTTVKMIDASGMLKQFASGGAEFDDMFFKHLVLSMVPRSLLIIFVEIFAYFFLGLYKSGLSEIKYFQNELTNIESKLASVEFAFITDQMDSLRSSLVILSQTERNFVLEKGQTTVELEKAKSDTEVMRNFIKAIPSLFKAKNK